uniref:DUF8206 domain-containing protein n=1 Tax=Ditylenchus dipsaci TaxID=166011 RepID=A0A915E8F9_9BILA
MLKTIEEFSSELKRVVNACEEYHLCCSQKTVDQVADYSKKLSLVKDTVLENAQKLVLYARSGGSMTEEVNSWEEVNAVTRIVKYKDSSPAILDYLEEDIRKRNTCIAKSNSVKKLNVYSSLPEALHGDPICVIPSVLPLPIKTWSRYLSSVEIHGIIIMLKPNNNKLNVIFKYCIGELLTHLHKNAAANIVFCFTNTSGNDFQPGDAIVPLKEYLKDIKQKQLVDIPINKDTVYCMDNEAFRYLWAVKSGVKFNEEAHESFARAGASLLKLLLECCATSVILSLISNITNPRQGARNLSLDVSSKNFKSKLMIQKTSIVHEMLNHPRTVCIADKHTEVREDISGRPQILYKTHCHSHCYLSGVAENTPRNPDLQRCEAMHGSLPYCNVSEKQSCEIDRSTES